MIPSIKKFIEETERLFDEKFEHSETCLTQRVEDKELVIGGACYCQLKDIKSFLRAHQAALMDALVDALLGEMPKEKKYEPLLNMNGTFSQPVFADAFNDCLQKVKQKLLEIKNQLEQ